MQRGLFFILLMIGVVLALPVQAAALTSRVNEAFQGVFGRLPNATESTYWLRRVSSGEKKTFEALQGAMYYAKAKASQPAGSVGTSKPASKDQLIKDVLPLFIKTFGNDPTNTEKAWWRKRISCNEIKTENDLMNSMNFHKSKKVRKGSDTICGAKAATATAASQSGVISRRVAGLSDHPMGDIVRIGIFSTDGRAIHVTADGQYQVREGEDIKATLGEDDVVQVSWSDGKYHVRGSGVELDLKDVVRLVPLNSAIMQVKSYSDASKTVAGKNYNRFRGVIEIRKCEGCKELWGINELRVEYYLRGLAETSGEGPEEYLKALSVAARTYVLYHKVVTGGRQQQKGYDIGKTADDQVYRGYEYEIITPRMASVFNKVKGVVVTDSEGDKLVTTVYFSDSDGRTRSAKEQWKTDRFPHLQSVDDPYHVASSCVGHCVGMSAQGAYGFASKDDRSWQWILKYFYKGVKLVKAY